MYSSKALQVLRNVIPYYAVLSNIYVTQLILHFSAMLKHSAWVSPLNNAYMTQITLRLLSNAWLRPLY